MFLLFFLAIKLKHFWVDKMDLNPDLLLVVMAAIYCLVMIALFYLSNLNTQEDFWDVTPAKRCLGGAYMHQGSSPEAKMCQEMMASEDGRCQLAQLNCGTGFIGQGRRPFEYTPLSDDNYQNRRCDATPSCSCGNDEFHSWNI
jgi:hypothetical protein